MGIVATALDRDDQAPPPSDNAELTRMLQEHQDDRMLAMSPVAHFIGVNTGRSRPQADLLGRGGGYRDPGAAPDSDADRTGAIQ